MKRKRLEKIRCEIDNCTVDNPKLLHKHHILERTEVNTNNNEFNLSIICSLHHNEVHEGIIEIIGVFPSTKPPYGRTLIYKRNGVANIPGIEIPITNQKLLLLR